MVIGRHAEALRPERQPRQLSAISPIGTSEGEKNTAFGGNRRGNGECREHAAFNAVICTSGESGGELLSFPSLSRSGVGSIAHRELNV